MSTAIVILNYNGKSLLEKFLPSVVMHSVGAKIYIADNNSEDDSIQFLNENYPELTLIQNKNNYGYAEGYNIALQQVHEDIICLLNSDVEVTENWLKPILNEFESHSNTAVIQPKILDLNNKEYFEYAGASGGYLDKFGYPYCRGRIFNTLEKDTGQYNDAADILWASGACFFIRNQVFKSSGGLDPRFFAHMEEIDLCWRLFNKGYNIKAIPDSKVYHLGGGTLNYDSPRKTYLNFRNNLFLLIKNSPGNLMGTMLIRLFLDGLAAIRFLFKFQIKNVLAVLKAHMSFYYYLPLFLKSRIRTSSQRKYYQTKSIVWSYFIKGKRTFSCL